MSTWILKSPQIIVDEDYDDKKPEKDMKSSENAEMLEPGGLYIDAKFIL